MRAYWIVAAVPGSRGFRVFAVLKLSRCRTLDSSAARLLVSRITRFLMGQFVKAPLAAENLLEDPWNFIVPAT